MKKQIALFMIIIGSVVVLHSQKNMVPNDKRLPEYDFIDANNFVFEYSRKSWRYSMIDSLYYDFDNKTINKKDSNNFEFELLSYPIPLVAKTVLTKEDITKIYLVAKKVHFELLPNKLELRKVFFLRDDLEQTVSIWHNQKYHRVTWDGIYPDMGRNQYVVKYRKIVDRFKELNDTIHSVLMRRNEIQQLYKGNSITSPMAFRDINLSETGFPKKYSSKIGNYDWTLIISE